MPEEQPEQSQAFQPLHSHVPNLEQFLQELYLFRAQYENNQTVQQLDLQSALDALSNRVSAGGAGSVTSALFVSVRDAFSNQLSVLSQAVSVLSQQVSALSQRLSGLSVINLPLRLSAPAAGATSVGLSIYAAASTIAADALGTDDLLIRVGDGGNIQIGDTGGSQNFTVLTGIDTFRVRFPAADWFWTADRFKIEHTSAALTFGVADDVAIERAGLSALLLSAASTKITGNLHVSGTLSAPILDTLSNQISVLSQGLSVVSNAASNALSVANAASNAASVVSVAAANATSIANAVSAKADTLSNQISVLSQQVSVLSQQVSVLSATLVSTWTSFVPAMSVFAGAAVFGTVTGRTNKIGRNVFIQLDATMTSTNTGSGDVRCTNLPYATAAFLYVMTGKEVALTNAVMNGQASGNNLTILNASGAYPGANGARFIITGVYEASS